ncbi:MAG: glycosyltransferase family 9 protein [Oligoflexia bacterium]|nr:glycosyltransferase family 9 protein [Oligoflexia bacterium]
MKLRALGDTVLMTAALAELKRAWPAADIHVAVTSTWAPLLENHPAVSQIWKYERFEDRGARAKSVMRLALKLRREHFDCVVNLHASPSSAMIAFATGAPIRSIHFHGHKDRNRHSTVEIPGKGIVKPIIERDMDAVRALGIQVPSGRLPQIYIHEREREEAAQRLSRSGLASTGPLLVIGLGASRPAKAWPIERYAELAVRWANDVKGGRVLAVLGPSEKSEFDDFLKALERSLLKQVSDPGLHAAIRSRITAERDLSLRQLAAVMTLASVCAGNDSGPRHIAVAVGCPTVTVFGPEDPFEWHPYDRKIHPLLYIENLPCRRDAMPGMPPWCGVHVCVQEQHRCMAMIDVDSVMTECRRVAR